MNMPGRGNWLACSVDCCAHETAGAGWDISNAILSSICDEGKLCTDACKLTSQATKGKRCCCRSVAQLLEGLIAKPSSLLSTAACLKCAINRGLSDLHS